MIKFVLKENNIFSIIKENESREVTVYHSSPNRNIEKFDILKIKDSRDYGPGIYFASRKEDTYSYGNSLYEIKLNLKNPIEISNNTLTGETLDNIVKIFNIESNLMDGLSTIDKHPISFIITSMESITSIKYVLTALLNAGYDGMIIKNDILKKKNPSIAGDYYAVFSPTSIVSIKKIEKATTTNDVNKVTEEIFKFIKQKEFATRNDILFFLQQSGLITNTDRDILFLINVLKNMVADKKIEKIYDEYIISRKS